MTRILFILFLSVISFNGFSQCPKAQEYIDKVKDANENWSPNKLAGNNCPQGWSQMGIWHINKCKGEKGVASIEDAERLVKIMNHTRDIIKNQFSPCGEIPPFWTVDKVKIVSSNNQNTDINQTEETNLGSYITGSQMSDDLSSLIGSLAENSSNPKLKKLQKEMTENSQRIDEGASNAEIFGPLNSSDHQILNLGKNVTQLFSIGKALFGSKKVEEKKITLTPSQLKASNEITKLSLSIRHIYNEFKAIPKFPYLNKETIGKLDNIEKHLVEYENHTAKNRLIVLTYYTVPNNSTYENLISLKSHVESLNTSQAIAAVAKLQTKLDDDFFIYLCNNDRAFKSQVNQIKMIKAMAYDEIGNKFKANEIRASVDVNLSINEAIPLVYQAYKNKKFETVTLYAPIISKHLLHKKNTKLYYEDLKNINQAIDILGLQRTDATYLLVTGVIAALKMDKISLSNVLLSELEAFQKKLELANIDYQMKSEKEIARKISKTNFYRNYAQCKSLYLAANSYSTLIKGDNQEALKYIDKAIYLNQQYPTINSINYKTFYESIKLEVLINLESYTDAKKLLSELKQKASSSLQIAQIYQYPIDKERLDFLNAFIRYKNKDFKGAILAIKIFKRKHPKHLNIILLEEKIYLTLNDVDAAHKAKSEYILKYKESKK